MTKIIRIPKRFFDLCENCETKTPPVVRETKAHYFVDMDCDPAHLEEFISRARVYVNFHSLDEYERPVYVSARATLSALAKEQDWIDARITANELDLAEI